ncbi:unnamed protein product [Linum tenue]|uniref:Secreted protein n=1 Tax=Linum tenue TaxID=586396 RepID=A0AAV0H361_9ROSI|nr:unnamed protein product [Linum tenue]
MAPGTCTRLLILPFLTTERTCSTALASEAEVALVAAAGSGVELGRGSAVGLAPVEVLEVGCREEEERSAGSLLAGLISLMCMDRRRHCCRDIYNGIFGTN